MGLNMWRLLHTIQLLMGWWKEQYGLSKKVWRSWRKVTCRRNYQDSCLVIMHSCITPQSTMGVLPVELLMGRRLRSAFELVKPDLHKRVEWGQEWQKAACDQQAVICTFKVGDPVYARNYKPVAMWEPAYVTEVMGCQRYRVKLLNEDKLWHRHQNQLRYHHVEDDNTKSIEISDSIGTFPTTGDYPHLSSLWGFGIICWNNCLRFYFGSRWKFKGTRSYLVSYSGYCWAGKGKKEPGTQCDTDLCLHVITPTFRGPNIFRHFLFMSVYHDVTIRLYAILTCSLAEPRLFASNVCICKYCSARPWRTYEAADWTLQTILLLVVNVP